MVNNLRHLPRHAALLFIFLCSVNYCFAQSGDPPTPAIEYNERAWKEFSPPAGGFTVLMPGTPDLTTIEVETPVGKLPHARYAVITGTAAYLVSYTDHPYKSEDPEAVKRALDAGRDNVLAQDPGMNVKLLSEREIALEGHAGREWLFHGNGFVLRARAYFVNGRIYQLVLSAPPNLAFKNGRPSADPQDRTEFYEMISARFLDSFKLMPAQEALGEVDRYLAREKAYGKVQGNPAGGPANAGVLEGKALSLPQPVYPRIFGNVRASGRVTVKVVVDEEGKVVAAQAISGHPLLQPAAVKAARAAQFAPTLLEGKPVKVVGTISYNFVAR
jgi:TonB family protein